MKIVHIVVGIRDAWPRPPRPRCVGIWAWYRIRGHGSSGGCCAPAQALLVLEAVLGGIWEISPHTAPRGCT